MESSDKMKVSLLELLEGYRSIATLGTCKNAGKTSVLNHLIDGYHKNIIMGITSIGYDGEAKDAVTNLAKPRVAVYPTMIIGTTASCLLKSMATYEVLKHTKMMTSIGEVMLVRVLSQGIMEIAGPSMSSQIEVLSQEMENYGCTKVIIDGAAGRRGYGCNTQAVVLSIGAAMSVELKKVVDHGHHLIHLMGLELYHGPLFKKIESDKVYQVQFDRQKTYIRFRGTVVDEDLLEIMKLYVDQQLVVIAKDPSALFITSRTVLLFERKGHKLTLEKTMNLVAVTINPMSPYGPYFNPEELERTIVDGIHVPIYNIRNEKGMKDGE